MINPSLPIPGVSGCESGIPPEVITTDCNGDLALRTVDACKSRWDWELTCASDDGGITKVPAVVVYDMLDPQNPAFTIYVGGVDVTGTYVPVICDIPLDREPVEKCFQDITDPSIKYTRLTILDLSVTPSVVIETLWFDANGIIVAAPVNVEACADSLKTVEKLCDTIQATITGNITFTATTNEIDISYVPSVVAANDTVLYFWTDFGDGYNDVGNSPSHVYADGNYEIKSYAVMASGNKLLLAPKEINVVSGVATIVGSAIQPVSRTYDIHAGTFAQLYVDGTPTGTPYNADGTPYTIQGVPAWDCPNIIDDLEDNADYSVPPIEVPYVPHVNGCIERTTITPTGFTCAQNVITYNFSDTDFVNFTIVAKDGLGNFTATQEHAPTAHADLLAVFNSMTGDNIRMEENVGNGAAIFNFWEGNVSNVIDVSPTVIQFDWHLEPGVSDTPDALITPCVDPIADSVYQATASTLAGIYDSVPLNTPIDNSGQPISFVLTFYSQVPDGETITVEHIPAKQIIKQNVDGTLTETYHVQGDINTEILFDNTTDVFVNVCTEAAQVVTAPCGGGLIPVTETLDAINNDYVNVLAPFTSTTVDLTSVGNENDGILTDGILWAATGYGEYMTTTQTIFDTYQYDRLYDDQTNVYNFAAPIVWDATTDPTGTTFIAALQTEIQNGLTALGIVYSSTDYTLNLIDPITLEFSFNIRDTSTNVTPYIYYIGGTADAYFYGYNLEFETNYAFPTPTLPLTATLTSVTLDFTADITPGDQAIIGMNIGGIFGDGANFYTTCAGTGSPQTYTYTIPLTGTDPISGSYTLGVPEVNSGVQAWFLFNPGNSTYNIEIDGMRLTLNYTVEDTDIVEVPVTIGCNDDRRDALLETINTSLTPTVEIPGGLVITSSASLPVIIGSSQIVSFSVKALNGTTYDISFDNGASWQKNIDGGDSWGEGTIDKIDVSQVIVAPNASGEVFVHWEV